VPALHHQSSCNVQDHVHFARKTCNQEQARSFEVHAFTAFMPNALHAGAHGRLSRSQISMRRCDLAHVYEHGRKTHSLAPSFLLFKYTKACEMEGLVRQRRHDLWPVWRVMRSNV
jgi:hypothetical protein